MQSLESMPKLYIPALAPLVCMIERYGFWLLRVATGAILIPHGVQKLFFGGAEALAAKTLAGWGLPLPLAWAYGIGVLETVGGILLVLGLWLRPVAALFIVELLVILFGVAWPNGYPWIRGGIQYPLLLLALMIAMFMAGNARRSLESAAYAFVRIATGLMVAWPGFEKVFLGGVERIAKGNVLKTGLEPPLFWAWAAGLTELIGGVLLVLGLFTRPAAFAVAVVLAVITFKVQWANGFFWQTRGYEVALLMTLCYVAFALGGGGRYSLDRRIGKEF